MAGYPRKCTSYPRFIETHFGLKYKEGKRSIRVENIC